ncbi:PREDICTED: cathepsin L1-like, partial [Rhagoletis zephyria]|uniref:cathepsin L1-like n=1 Tax=Rhagoletis zephyria TaxID=28612 RepID=UPI0008117290
MAAMESSYMLKHNKRGVSFSEMNLFNCMHKDGVYTDKSCHNGGDVAAVYQAARDHGLVLTKDDEPYMSKISRTDSNFTFVFKPKHCDIKPVVTRLQNWGSISEVNGPQRENILKSLLLKYGPLTTYFRADKAFMALTGEWNRPCNQSVAINHVMTVIGWTKKHWIMKNSYGNYPKIVLPKNEWGEEEGEAPQTWFLPFG